MIHKGLTHHPVLKQATVGTVPVLKGRYTTSVSCALVSGLKTWSCCIPLSDSRSSFDIWLSPELTSQGTTSKSKAANGGKTARERRKVVHERQHKANVKPKENINQHFLTIWKTELFKRVCKRKKTRSSQWLTHGLTITEWSLTLCLEWAFPATCTNQDVD